MKEKICVLAVQGLTRSHPETMGGLHACYLYLAFKSHPSEDNLQSKLDI